MRQLDNQISLSTQLLIAARMCLFGNERSLYDPDNHGENLRH
jgi:hypothetical protein